MKTVLLLLTDAKLDLPKQMARQSDAGWKVESVDLTRKDVDYREVLEKIFEADSVQVW